MYTVKWDEFGYTKRQFGFWRVAFGLYLAFFLIRLFPFGTELLTRDGPFSTPDFYRDQTFFPSFLLTLDTPALVKTMLVVCIVFAFMIALGFYRRLAALGLWLLILWMYNRNPYIDSPEYEFVNWLIFALIFIPTGESFCLGSRGGTKAKSSSWYMPPLFYWGAWIVLAAGYFFAGGSKFRSLDSTWLDGTAMYYVLTSDNARLAWYGDFFNRIPIEFYIPLTLGGLYLQTLTPIMVCFRYIRPWWWLASTGMHVALLFLVNLSQLTLGMVFFHFFLFDQKWLSELSEVPFLRRFLARFNDGPPSTAQRAR